ncbi:phospholipase D family protein [Algoriphagus taiwanensis]|uniref:PLD phosphodiesterase domain-containing protein n=1 Tax=Algoriphagus taiwanensis TaxID=1445656 RepID=A0ABQ6Q2M0_9BACT|nr:hypothetical protein Ataiwa_26910 [Algoriphagus taiwanensis]
MIKTIHENWLKIFKENLTGVLKVKIISPFISEIMVNHLLKEFKGDKIQVITRYNLNDFRSGVSSIKAVEKLLKNGAEIKGIQGLHAKIYLFDSNSVIITSANFTSGGFFNNREFGLITNDSQIVNSSESYFNKLWQIDPLLLNRNKLKDWILEINNYPQKINSQLDNLKDYGASYVEQVTKGRKYFIKFFGLGNDRADMNTLVEDNIRYGVAHYALSFSKTTNDRRPNRYRDGDIVFMAQLSRHSQNDYSIFARAVTIKHHRFRDVAGPEDFKHLDWIKDWPIFVRLKEVQFINGTYKDCPKMNDLINDLDFESFESTSRNHKNGSGNISPKSALRQKADIQLSEAGAIWLEESFEKAIQTKGAIPEDFINKFYRGIKL